jgi:hypothetical protein
LPQRAWPGRLDSLRDKSATDSSGPDKPTGAVAAVTSPARGKPGTRPGRPQPDPLAGQEADPADPDSRPAARMTARGAVLAMFLLFFLGTLTAGWLHLGVLTGLSFLAGAALAARYTRRDGLLAVVVTPPLLFFIALVGVEVLTSHAGTVKHSLTSAAEGTILTLAAVAPWLFAGIIAGLAIALFRGLPQCVRDLRTELRGDVGLRGPSAPTGPAAQRGAAAQRDPRGTGGR